jgi:hypothetical protein
MHSCNAEFLLQISDDRNFTCPREHSENMLRQRLWWPIPLNFGASPPKLAGSASSLVGDPQVSRRPQPNEGPTSSTPDPNLRKAVTTHDVIYILKGLPPSAAHNLQLAPVPALTQRASRLHFELYTCSL